MTKRLTGMMAAVVLATSATAWAEQATDTLEIETENGALTLLT